MQTTPAKPTPTYFNIPLTYEALSKAIREKGRQKDFPLPPMEQVEKDVREIVEKGVDIQRRKQYNPEYMEIVVWIVKAIERRLNLPDVSPGPLQPISNPVCWLYIWACEEAVQWKLESPSTFRALFQQHFQNFLRSAREDPENSWWLPAFEQAAAQALKGLDESVLRALSDGKLLSRNYQPLPEYNRWHKIVIVEEYTEFLELTDKPWAQFELLWGMSRYNLKKHQKLPVKNKKKEVDAFRTKIKECLKAQKRKNSALGL